MGSGLIVGTAQAPQLEEHQGEGEAGQRHRQQCAARLRQWAQGQLRSASNAGRLPSRPSTSAAARIRGSGPIRHRSMIAPPANLRRATRTECKREVLATRRGRGKQSSMPAGQARLSRMGSARCCRSAADQGTADIGKLRQKWDGPFHRDCLPEPPALCRVGCAAAAQPDVQLKRPVLRAGPSQCPKLKIVDRRESTARLRDCARFSSHLGGATRHGRR